MEAHWATQKEIENSKETKKKKVKTIKVGCTIKITMIDDQLNSSRRK